MFFQLSNYKWFLITSVAIIFVFGNCNQDPVTPVVDIKEGRRDYVWTVDTLNIPQYDIFTPTRIWGNTANDVWLIGIGDAGDLLWHYDGISWKRDQTRYQIAPYALWGTDQNNIWMGNTNNSFWKYDGTHWFKFSEHLYPNYTSNWIVNLYGTGSSDIYGVGSANSDTSYRGIIMHYDGNQWSYLTIPDEKILFTDIRIQKTTGLIFMEGYTYLQASGTSYKLILYDHNIIKELYASSDNVTTVNEISGEIYLVAGKKIFIYKNKEMVLWQDFSNTSFLGKVWGRSEKDFFSFASDGIGHYNGLDFKTVYIVPWGFKVSNGFVLENDVFFPCFSRNSNINIVIHGKLSKSAI